MTRLRYALLLCGSLAWGQTQIDLRTQSKSVDFSSAASTKTAKTGATLPVSCSPGEIFFNTAARPGTNLYACTAANTWTPQGAVVTPNYSKPFTSVTTLSVSGAEHLLNTSNLVVTCYDASTPARMIEPDSITVDPTTYAVSVTFAQSQSGRCVINGNSIPGAGGALPAVGSLNFGPINNGACSSEMTFSAPGTLAGDNVAPGWPASLPPSVMGRMRIVSNGVAGVQLCNFSGATISVSANFQLTVVRSF
jgi:hypothetical protein